MTSLFAQGGPVIPDFGKGDPCIVENGRFCLNWFVDNFGDRFAPRLLEHVYITLIAMGIGFAIAFTAGVLAHRQRWLEAPFANLAALFYTIPSIAFFQIMVPVTGINLTTIEIALVSYTLLVLFRNTVTGLREVPVDAKEAAEGMGFTPMQTLIRVELPLAMPAIIAGVRVATVTTISLATVAAFISPDGLGALIFSAIQSGANTEFVGASLLAIVLALVADALIVLAARFMTPWTRARTLAK